MDDFPLFPSMRFPYGKAPRTIKSIYTVYDTSKNGTLKHYNYTPKNGTPRPWWTYRASRRNKSKNV